MPNRAELAGPLLDLVSDIVFLYDEEGRYRYANAAAADFLGCGIRDIVGSTHEDLFPARTAEQIRERQRQALATGEPVRRVYSFEFASGERRFFEGTMTPVAEGEVGFRGVAGVVRDVTDRQRARRALTRAKRKYEAVFDVNPVALAVIDFESGRVVEVNRGFEELYGYRASEVMGEPLAEMDLVLDSERMARLRERVLEQDEVRGEVLQVRRRDGRVRDVHLSCVRVTVADEVYLVGASQDISPLKETERRLRHRALHDALTGLPNQDLFWDRCEQALARAARSGTGMAVGYLDLDGFKTVNDSRGHPAGDELLAELARRLERRLRNEDTIARMGGDEFALVFEVVGGLAEARTAVRRLFRAFEAPVSIAGDEVEVRASGGIVVADSETTHPGDAEPPTERVQRLLERADRVMYSVKEEGGGGFRVVADV